MELNKQDLELAGALRRLLKNRFLLRSKNEKWFQVIVDLRSEIQKSLKSFAAELEINETLGVAFVKESSAEIEDALEYQLGRKKNLSSMGSLLVFHLRSARLKFFTDPGKLEAPLITLSEIREFLQNFNVAKIDSQFERNFRRAVEELCEFEIFFETKSGSDIFEISPLCDLLLPADSIQFFGKKAQDYFNQEGSSNA